MCFFAETQLRDTSDPAVVRLLESAPAECSTTLQPPGLGELADRK